MADDPVVVTTGVSKKFGLQAAMQTCRSIIR